MGGSSQQKVDLKEVREKQALARSQLLRQAYGFLPENAFKQRQKYFAAKVNTTTWFKPSSQLPHHHTPPNESLLFEISHTCCVLLASVHAPSN